jgi:hypothetical protein
MKIKSKEEVIQQIKNNKKGESKKDKLVDRVYVQTRD